jgi:hypothetical protein
MYWRPSAAKIASSVRQGISLPSLSSRRPSFFPGDFKQPPLAHLFSLGDRPLAHRDVVLLAPGEMVQGVGIFLVADHAQIDGDAALQQHARFRRP